MALFLYPNVCGLETVLFVFYFSFTVAKKFSKLDPLGVTPSLPRLQKSEETTFPAYKHLWSEYKSYAFLKNKTRKKSAADCYK